jgi:hypothetical protein
VCVLCRLGAGAGVATGVVLDCESLCSGDDGGGARQGVFFFCRSFFSYYSSDEPISALFVVAIETSMVCTLDRQVEMKGNCGCLAPASSSAIVTQLILMFR